MAVSKKIKRPAFTSRNGVEVELQYCRRCRKTKSPNAFFTATDLLLDTNGLMSVCRDCISDIYTRIYQNEHSIEKSILRVCRMMNVKYDEAIVANTMKTLKEAFDNGKQKDDFATYKGVLMRKNGTRIGDRALDSFTFTEPFNKTEEDGTLEASDEPEDFKEYLNQFWGISFSFDDYSFLEKEFSEWKRTHKCDTKAEESLLKELCYKELEIRKARIEGRSTATLVKEKQDLMKTASVDPAKTAIAGGGRSQDTFSAFIKTIEENEPADFYKDKKLFKDFDNIDFYFKKYVTRPLKNFITQSRDFNVEADNGEEEDFVESEVFEDGDLPTSISDKLQ